MIINVAAGVIKNSEGKILIAQRDLDRAQGGLWEFPGGKLEEGETREDALKREIKEELMIDIEVEKYLDEKTFQYPEKEINLIVLECKLIGGKLKATEHEDVKWINKEELKNYEFVPADLFIIEKFYQSNVLMF